MLTIPWYGGDTSSTQMMHMTSVSANAQTIQRKECRAVPAGCGGKNPTPGADPVTTEGPGKTRPSAAPHLVERKTALRGCSIDPRRVSQSSRRRNTRMDLIGRDPEVPYVKFEAAANNLVCSLLERQDRMNEEILLRVIDLQYRVDNLELDFAEHRKISIDDEPEERR